MRIGNIISIARGASPRPIKAFITEDTNGINWIKIGDTTEGDKYINSSKEKITQEGSLKSRVVHSGDFLLTNSMSFGHPYILNIDGCVHDGWLILSDYSSCYDKLFLYYLLSSSFAYIQFSEAASGTTVKNLNSDKVSSSIFPLPPLAEQKRIVDKLMSFLAVIDKAEELIEKKANIDEEIRNKILDLAIRGKLVEQRPEEGKKKLIAEGKIKKEKPLPEITDDEIPFEIPESWKWVYIGNIIELVSGRDLTLHDISSVPSGFPYLTGASQITPEEIIINRWTTNPAVISQLNDILLTCKGTVGKIIINNIGEIHIARQIMALRNRSVCIHNKYLKLFLEDVVSYLISKANGLIPGISREDILYLKFPLPPLAEQKRIVAKIEELLPYCDKLK